MHTSQHINSDYCRLPLFFSQKIFFPPEVVFWLFFFLFRSEQVARHLYQDQSVLLLSDGLSQPVLKRQRALKTIMFSTDSLINLFSWPNRLKYGGNMKLDRHMGCGLYGWLKGLTNSIWDGWGLVLLSSFHKMCWKDFLCALKYCNMCCWFFWKKIILHWVYFP